MRHEDVDLSSPPQPRYTTSPGVTASSDFDSVATTPAPAGPGGCLSACGGAGAAALIAGPDASARPAKGSGMELEAQVMCRLTAYLEARLQKAICAVTAFLDESIEKRVREAHDGLALRLEDVAAAHAERFAERFAELHSSKAAQAASTAQAAAEKAAAATAAAAAATAAAVPSLPTVAAGHAAGATSVASQRPAAAASSRAASPAGSAAGHPTGDVSAAAAAAAAHRVGAECAAVRGRQDELEGLVTRIATCTARDAAASRAEITSELRGLAGGVRLALDRLEAELATLKRAAPWAKDSSGIPSSRGLASEFNPPVRVELSTSGAATPSPVCLAEHICSPLPSPTESASSKEAKASGAAASGAAAAALAATARVAGTLGGSVGGVALVSRSASALHPEVGSGGLVPGHGGGGSSPLLVTAASTCGTPRGASEAQPASFRQTPAPLTAVPQLSLSSMPSPAGSAQSATHSAATPADGTDAVASLTEWLHERQHTTPPRDLVRLAARELVSRAQSEQHAGS